MILAWHSFAQILPDCFDKEGERFLPKAWPHLVKSSICSCDAICSIQRPTLLIQCTESKTTSTERQTRRALGRTFRSCFPCSTALISEPDPALRWGSICSVSHGSRGQRVRLGCESYPFRTKNFSNIEACATGTNSVFTCSVWGFCNSMGCTNRGCDQIWTVPLIYSCEICSKFGVLVPASGVSTRQPRRRPQIL